MALNPAFKLAIGIYILCAVLSFLNAVGAIHTDTSSVELNVTDEKFNTMFDPAALSEGEPLEVQQEQYMQAGFDLKGFIFGAVYVKGVVDELAHYNWVVGLAKDNTRDIAGRFLPRQHGVLSNNAAYMIGG